MATVLKALQSASVKLIKRKPVNFFTSSGTFELELSDMATDVAREIGKSHDWESLGRLHRFTGDGTTTEFDKPDDYDRMLKNSEIQDVESWFWGYGHVTDVNVWRYQVNSGLQQITPGVWILYGGKFNFYPAPTSGAEAEFPYISKMIATSAGGVEKDEITADNDTFFEENRLLMLGLVWRWRAENRLDFTSDYENYQKALDDRVSRDKGARILRDPKQRWRDGSVRYAYPLRLG